MHSQMSDTTVDDKQLQQPATNSNGELPIRPFLLESKGDEHVIITGKRQTVKDMPRKAADQNYKIRTAEMSDTEVATELLCKNHEDVFPGSIIESGTYPYYKPDRCTLKTYSARQMSICIDSNRYLGLGDSLLRAVMAEIHVPDKKRIMEGNWYHGFLSSDSTKGMEFYGTASYNKHQSKGTSHFFKSDDIDKSLAAANIIVLNAGTWDMGRSFDGFWEFYVRVKFRLQYIKKHKSKNARVIIMSPHWLHLDRCVRLCSACNSPEKTRVFREAVELAASCEGVEYYDPSQLIKIVSDTSKVSIDGIHYRREYADIESDLFFNAVCREPPLKAKVPIHCNETLAFKRWSAVPEASLGCYNMTVEQVRDAKRYKGHSKININYIKKKRSRSHQKVPELPWLRVHQEMLEFALFVVSFITVCVVFILVNQHYGFSSSEIPGITQPMIESVQITDCDIEDGYLFKIVQLLTV